eukprot:scaffold119768_cov33-Tisochrysis_lutea.AAC.3
MPRKVEVPLPSRDVLAPARDILLFQGDYAIFYYVFLALYCAACCRTLRENCGSSSHPSSASPRS